jgi:uncharacterized phage-like protein YoqJ
MKMNIKKYNTYEIDLEDGTKVLYKSDESAQENSVIEITKTDGAVVNLEYNLFMELNKALQEINVFDFVDLSEG